MVTITIFWGKFYLAKSSNFNRNSVDLEFGMRAKDFPMQISQRVQVGQNLVDLLLSPKGNLLGLIVTNV